MREMTQRWFDPPIRPELYAQELRHELKINQFPVDIPGICAALGIVYREDNLGRAGGYEGVLLREGGYVGILVNQNIPYPGRRRFTGAHELGHYRIKHHTQKEYWCTPQDIEDFRSPNAVEAEANRFAAELLLPSERISAALRREAPSMDLIRSIADEYGTSLTAAGLKVVKMASNDACALVMCADGRVRWSLLSQPMRRRYEVRTGALSENTYAYDAFQGRSLPTGPKRVRADAWLIGVGPDADLVEHSLAFTDLGLVLTLLTFPEPADDDSEGLEW